VLRPGSPADLPRRVAVRRRGVALGVVIGGVALVAAFAVGPLASPAVHTQPTPLPVATAQVARRTLDATTQVDGTLGYASSYGATSDPPYSILIQATAAQPPRTLTQLVPVGAIVKPGDVLYTLDGLESVVLMDGQIPTWRDLAAGVPDGPDVEQLEANLKTLGVAPPSMTVDPHWDGATTTAVDRWQAALGLPQTGAIPLGRIVFEPGPLRITAHAAALGASLQPGAAVLIATSTRRVVSVALDPALQTDVRRGDAVTVGLPDGSTAAGRVADVGTVATAASSQGQAPGASQPPTIQVSVMLDDPSVAGTLDQAPVTVSITTATVTNVLAVPIPALVQLLEGGDAVQLEEGGSLRYVPVRTGLFASGWVEVSGPGLAEGQTVVVAQ
jgi:hypothetical protein